jgi:hypothetical protein
MLICFFGKKFFLYLPKHFNTENHGKKLSESKKLSA